MIWQRLFMAGLSLLLAGCSFNSSIHKPQAPQTYSQTLEGTATATGQQPWWHLFNSQELQTLLAKLSKQNLQLRQAQARIAQARAAWHGQEALRWPSLDVSGQTSRSSQPGAMQRQDTTSEQIGFAANYEVDLWGKLAQRAQAGERQYQASRYDYQSLYLTLSTELAHTFFEAVAQREQICLTRETITTYKDNLRLVKRRYQRGLVPQTDVQQARDNLARARSQLPQYRQAYAQARHALALLTGRTPANLPQLQTAQLPQTPPALPAGLPADLLQQRPDVAAAWQRLQATNAQVAAAVAQRFPTVNLLANLGSRSSETGSSVVSGRYWDITGKLLAPLIDFGRRKAQVAEQRTRLQEQQATLERQLLVAIREVEDALSGNYYQKRRLKRLQQQVATSRASLASAQRRYQQGLSTYLPVLTAQTRLLEARRQRISTAKSLLQQRIALIQSLGGSWLPEPPTSGT